MTHCHCCHDDAHHEPHAGGRSLRAAELAALLLLAAFLAYSSASGRVPKFVAPAYVWFPPAAALLLGLMAVARMLRGKIQSACDCAEHGSRAVRWLFTAALLVPIALALAADPQEFSAEGMRKRRLSPAARDVQLDRAIAWVLGRSAAAGGGPAAAAEVPAEPTVLQLAQAADNGQAEGWAGRFVTVIGQCDAADESTRTFELYRLVVTCCVADSQAVSVEVAMPPDIRLESRQWVRVAGVLRWRSDAAGGRLFIHAATISKIPVPAMPYL